ncbi:MAG: 2Fe-2S iron-sulfur cluster-binding protein [Paracoccaceae bacterium]
MARFLPLTVTEVRKTIRDAVVVTLQPENPADFTFAPGQYLTFRRDFDGEELRRSYSICSGADDGLLQVGIKRVEGGTFSTWANTELEPGAVLEAMAPMGSFTTEYDAGRSRHLLGFAGGSGITPIMSILRSLLAREPKSRFTLVYANKGIGTIMFREELEDLKNTHMGRLNVIHVLEDDAQEIDLFTGLVTREKCADLFANWIDIANVDGAFICGPEPMMLGIAAALRDHGLDDAQIRFELFASSQPGRAAKPAGGTRAKAASGATEVVLTLDGATRRLSAATGETLLETALAGSVDAPFACRAGVCSTCRCRVLEGEVEMRTNHALEDYEVARGYVLSCQAVPVSARVVVDYDQ